MKKRAAKKYGIKKRPLVRGRLVSAKLSLVVELDIVEIKIAGIGVEP